MDLREISRDELGQLLASALPQTPEDNRVIADLKHGVSNSGYSHVVINESDYKVVAACQPKTSKSTKSSSPAESASEPLKS